MRVGIVAASALLILLPAPSAAPQATTVEGVNFTETIKAGDVDLKLRGAGLLRYMVFIKAYVGAFYLPEKVPSDQALTCERAELDDGMDILELGCGWGSLSLWMAARYAE